MFSDYKYCFLKNVLTDMQDNTRGFRLVLSSSDMKKQAVYTTDAKGLFSLSATDSLIKDFRIENGMLQCDDIARVQIIAEDIEMFDKVIPISVEIGSFTDFLGYGAGHDFLIVDKSILEHDCYVGGAFALFNSIEFSQGTMSVYARIVNDGSLHNEMLVKMEDHLLSILNFHFACKIDIKFPEWFKDEYYTFKKTVEINNDMYNIYQMKNMPLYPSDVFIANAYINKAVTLRTKFKNMIGVTEELRSTLYNMKGSTFGEKLEWSGGNKSYVTPYGVYFKSSLPNITKNQKISCIEWFFDLITKYNKEDDVMTAIKNESASELVQLAMQLIYSLMLSDDDMSVVIVNCTDTINQLRSQMLQYDFYLYKVRLYAYLRCINIAPKSNPILLGSDESAYTIVDSRLFYGMV